MRTLLILFLLTPALWSGCKSFSDEGGKVIVRYKNQELTLDELRFHLPKGVSPTDSIRFAKLYIEQWKTEQCLADEAESKINDLDKRLEYQLRDYKRKMAIDQLHQYLLNSSQETAVSEEEAIRYYKDNIQEFISSENMYWYGYIKSSDAQIQQLNNQIISPNLAERNALADWCKKHAEEYKLDDAYASQQELNALSETVKNDLSRINANTAPSLLITKEGENIKYHLFFMRDVVKPGKYIPYASVKNSIKKDILLNRQTTQIEQYEINIYEKARASKEFIENEP